jgi:D-psicose/D-tagatose/L-ribulose 3-epimerase
MCKRIGLANVRAHLDVYHMNIEESDMAQAIVDTGEYLGYFHTGDSHRGYMGSGSIDLAGAFRAVVKSGYQGPITFESFSSRVVGQPLEGILGIWRNLWEDSVDLATHALMYTKAQLKAAQEAQKQAARSKLRRHARPCAAHLPAGAPQRCLGAAVGRPADQVRGRRFLKRRAQQQPSCACSTRASTR